MEKVENLFDFYGLPFRLDIDVQALRRKYLDYNRLYHPDFHSDGTDEQKAEALELSTLNNLAYKTLLNLDSRIQYVLELKGLLDEDGAHGLDQDFLMEMMDINEALMELEFDYDAGKSLQLHQTVAGIENQILKELQPVMKSYDGNTSPNEELIPAKNFYKKMKYLLRIKENLLKFAP